MTLMGALVVFLTSLTALPWSYFLNTISHLKDQRLILISGLVSFCLVAAVPWLILRRNGQKVESLLCVLSLLTFTSVLSLVIALENDGLIAEFVGFYLKEGEPYLKTAHGTMMSYWDGVAHYGLYLMMLAAVSWNQAFYDVGLYWVGSFTYNKLVLILAVFMGQDGLRWPFLLNFPCLAICALLSLRFLEEKSEECQRIKREMKEGARKDTGVGLSIWQRPLDLALVVYYGTSSLFIIFRFIGVMGGNVALVKLYCEKIEPYLTDPLPFPKAQIMIQVFYFIPYHVMIIFALLYPGQSWVPKLSLLHAAAAGQSQFSFMGSSFHYRTPYIHRLPQTGLARSIFWLVNGLMFAMPQVTALRCLENPHFFLHREKQAATEHNVPVHTNGSNTVGNSTVVKKTE